MSNVTHDLVAKLWNRSSASRTTEHLSPACHRAYLPLVSQHGKGDRHRGQIPAGHRLEAYKLRRNAHKRLPPYLIWAHSPCFGTFLGHYNLLTIESYRDQVCLFRVLIAHFRFWRSAD